MCKTILMTGTCTVFGKLIADTLAKEGNSIIAAMHTSAGQNIQPAKELNKLDNVEVVNVDMTSDESVNSAITYINKKYGPVDVLINNEGVAGFGPVQSTSSLEQIKNLLEVNLLGVIRAYQAVLPSMQANKSGLIINITYDGGGAKFALEAIAESVRKEMKEYGIENVTIPCKADLFELDGHCACDGNYSATKNNNPEISKVAFDKVLETTYKEIEDLQNNAQAIADGVLSLINMKKGTRPYFYAR